MATYLMFGRYSLGAVKEISAERTEKAAAVVKELGGKVKGGYAMLGKDDLVLVVDLPDTGAAMKASIALSKLLKISFTTAPAVSIEEFDELVG
jgi:uncharacterized protein with GYD domain